MSIGIDIQNLGNPDAKEPLRSSIEKMFEGRVSDWHISVIGAANATKWEVKIKEVKEGGGFKWVRNFDGAGEHSPSFIADEIRRILPH